MHVVHESFELTRIIFVIGAFFSLFYRRNFGVTPGAILLPGACGLCLFASPVIYASLICICLLTHFFSKLLLDRHTFSTHTRTIINVAISATLALVIIYFMRYGGITLLNDFFVVFMVLPGIFVTNAHKYKLRPVISAVLITSSATYLIGLGLSLLIQYSILSKSYESLGGLPRFFLNDSFIVVPVSIFFALVTHYAFGVRIGGYVAMPIVAQVLANSFTQFLMVLVMIVVMYILVRLVLAFTQITGLNRFLICLCLGVIFSTLSDLVASSIFIQGYTTSVISIAVGVAIIVNDLCLYNLRKALIKGVLPSFLVATSLRLAL